MSDTLEVLSVRPHEVERGDVLLGTTSPVESILFDCGEGAWWYYADRLGTVIARRGAGAQVQVIRGGITSDDTPPHGTRREQVGTAEALTRAPLCRCDGDDPGCPCGDREIILSAGTNFCSCDHRLPGWASWVDGSHTCERCGLLYVLDGVEVAIYATDEVA